MGIPVSGRPAQRFFGQYGQNCKAFGCFSIDEVLTVDQEFKELGSDLDW
jgi:hypothetical protein